MVNPPKAPPPDRVAGKPAYWLMKSEPDKYSWHDLVRDGRTRWDGIRNHQVAIYLRSMMVGDLGLFYHSNAGLEVVGIVEIVREFYPDPTDPSGRFVAVDVKPHRVLSRPVTLAEMKANPALSQLPMFRQFRLSLVPVRPAEWETILAMAGNT
jgi:predicted RNA-binding protein with PUA-like domain